MPWVAVGVSVDSGAVRKLLGTAPSVRNTSSGNLTSATAVTLPAFTPGSDLLVVVVESNLFGGGVAPTAPAGWTHAATQTSASGNSQLDVFTIQSIGSDTFVSGTTVTAAAYVAYSVPVYSGTVDVTATQRDVISTITSPGVTTTGANRLVISCFGADSVATPTIGTPSAGAATAQQTNGNVGLVTASQLASSAGATVAVTASLSGGTEWQGITIAIY